MKNIRLLTTSILAMGLLSASANADTIRFWTTENQPERLAKQEAMATDFNKKTGHTVEVIPVEEKDLGTRTTAAFAAGDLESLGSRDSLTPCGDSDDRRFSGPDIAVAEEAMTTRGPDRTSRIWCARCQCRIEPFVRASYCRACADAVCLELWGGSREAVLLSILR